MKTGFWLRGGNGKLAGATVYQDGQGNTVMREVVSPSNPKTRAQMIQRIVMHTVMQAYSKMKEICDHSLEGVKKGQETMSLFMKENVQKCLALAEEGAVNPIYAGNNQYLNNAGEGGGAAATTDSGSGSGSGSSEQTQNTFAISSASVNNQAIVVGTVKKVYCQEGEDTESLDIRMTFSNKGNATAIIVEKNGAQVGAEHTISGTSASFTIAQAAQGLYTIKVKKSDNTLAAPGYQVRLNAYVSSGPDDNGYDPELGDGN